MESEKKDRDIFLRNDIFKSLTAEDFKLLEKSKSFLEYKKGENIIKQGTYLSTVYFVTDGLAKLYIEASNGKRLIIKILTPYEIVGLINLFSEKHHNFSVVALTPVKVYFFDAIDFKSILEKNNQFAYDLLQWQSKINTFWLTRIITLGTKQMHGRLADALLYLTQKTMLKNSIFEFLSRNDLAELTGMSKENAIRLLSEFKHDGIITIKGKRIEIKNQSLLERLSLIG